MELVAPLAGGARNQVWLAARGDQRLVVRRSSRPPASLDWELELLDFLGRHGIGVPRTLPADDGRRHVDGVLVQGFVDGAKPQTTADWRLVVEALVEMHWLTIGWPQRPGFATSQELQRTDRGGDVRLDLLPADAAELVRAAWRPIATGAECVVHGDVGGGNVLVHDGRATLLDWDEARVDVPWFDYAFLPDEIAAPSPVDRQTLATAGLAWEVATCWSPEPVYAARCLNQLRERVS